MTLVLQKVYDIDSNSNRVIESVSEDLVLLTNEVKADTVNFDSRPYHWRCEFGDFPPLDISLDSDTGLLKEITVFIKKRDIGKDVSALLHLPKSCGYPAFRTDIWRKHEHYYDEYALVEIFVVGESLYIRKQECDPVEILRVNITLDIMVDKNNLFAGLIVRDLTGKELDLLLQNTKI